jgi:hypothetical protein
VSCSTFGILAKIYRPYLPEQDLLVPLSLRDWLPDKALYRASTTGPQRVVVITDNSRYHHARLHQTWREKHADRFTLDYLPPYSPDLNPIERV